MKMSNENYFASDGLNFSIIKELTKSPKHFWDAMENTKQPTKQMTLGTLIHAAILEPDTFKDLYVAEPGFDKRTKDYKNWLLENEGKIPYDANELGAIITAAANAVYSESLNLIFKNQTINEESFFFKKGNLDLKCKVDAYCPGNQMLIDIKTSSDISPQKFKHQLFDRLYHLQLCHYIEGLESGGCKVSNARIVAISTTPPYDVVEYQLSQEVLERGKEELYNLYDEVMRVITFNDHDGFCQDVVEVNYPDYYKSKFI